MKIVCASDDFHSRFSVKEQRGSIHSVFRHVLNIKMENRIYTIGDSTVSVGPCTAILDVRADFESWRILKGSAVVSRPETGMIHLGGWSRDIVNRPERIWQSGFDPEFAHLDQSRVEENLRGLLDRLVVSGDRDSLAPLIPILEPHFRWLEKTDIDFGLEHDSRWNWISKRMIRLLQTVEKREWERVSVATQGIIGFGPGLTPSTDDFVVGLIAGLLYSSQDGVDLLRHLKWFVQDISGMTTDISYEALWHAAYGRVNRLLRQAALGIVSSGDLEAIEDLLKVGQTSGSDLTTGLYFGIKINQCKGEH